MSPNVALKGPNSILEDFNQVTDQCLCHCPSRSDLLDEKFSPDPEPVIISDTEVLHEKFRTEGSTSGGAGNSEKLLWTNNNIPSVAYQQKSTFTNKWDYSTRMKVMTQQTPRPIFDDLKQTNNRVKRKCYQLKPLYETSMNASATTTMTTILSGLNFTIEPGTAWWWRNFWRKQFIVVAWSSKFRFKRPATGRFNPQIYLRNFTSIPWFDQDFFPFFKSNLNRNWSK